MGPAARVRRFSASKVYNQRVPLPSLVMFPAASYAYVESVLMWLLASTVAFNEPKMQGGGVCVPLLILVRLATASSATVPSGPKFCPQQSAPEVDEDFADRMRLSGS